MQHVPAFKEQTAAQKVFVPHGLRVNAEAGLAQNSEQPLIIRREVSNDQNVDGGGLVHTGLWSEISVCNVARQPLWADFSTGNQSARQAVPWKMPSVLGFPAGNVYTAIEVSGHPATQAWHHCLCLFSCGSVLGPDASLPLIGLGKYVRSREDVCKNTQRRSAAQPPAQYPRCQKSIVRLFLDLPCLCLCGYATAQLGKLFHRDHVFLHAAVCLLRHQCLCQTLP